MGHRAPHRERQAMFTLRYIREAPIFPRPHAPTVAKFPTYEEAYAHLLAQDNADVLEVVER